MATSATGIATRPYSEFQRLKKEGASGGSQASAMALGSVKSIGKFTSSLYKGTMIDLPLAVTEGLRATPKLYGEHVPDHEPITDWKSGAVVAGKVSLFSNTCIKFEANVFELGIHTRHVGRIYRTLR